MALVAHPDDDRYRPSVRHRGGHAAVRGRGCPVLAHELADPDKGSGIAMICTFGDTTDVTWWRELSLPTRTIVGRNGRLPAGRLGRAGLGDRDAAGAAAAYGELAGRTVTQARTRIVEMLAGAGRLVGEPRPIRHPVKFYERGDRPLEIVSSRQWYVRTLPLRDRLLDAGPGAALAPALHGAPLRGVGGGAQRRLEHQPAALLRRALPGLVPGRTTTATVDHDHPLVAAEDRLPVDPSTDVPDGYTEDQRGAARRVRRRPRRHGHLGHLVAHPPDRRPAGRTIPTCSPGSSPWTCDPRPTRSSGPGCSPPSCAPSSSTGRLPWTDAAISGWVLDPDRKKMSKSKGNVVTPLPLLETHGADGVRYWAASGRPGDRHRRGRGPDEGGPAPRHQGAQRLAVRPGAARPTATLPGAEAVTAPLDLAMLHRLAEVVDEATAAFEAYDYARALERTEAFFWSFCDDYLELVKARAYEDPSRPGPASARAALGLALSVLLRLLAPFLPFVTEEVWSWWHDGSIHRSPWPGPDELPPPRRDRRATTPAVPRDRATPSSASSPRFSEPCAGPRRRPNGRCAPRWPD